MHSSYKENSVRHSTWKHKSDIQYTVNFDTIISNTIFNIKLFKDIESFAEK